MKRLLIIGAGGFGREVLGWALDVDVSQRDWEVGGFLDSNLMALRDYTCPVNNVLDLQTFVPSENDRLVCAIGDPATKLRVCMELKARGGQFITLIHPTAIIGYNCCLGEGCIICPSAIVTTNVTLGKFVTLNLNATVGHDALVGDGCTLSPHANVTGKAILGEGVFLGSHASVLPSAKVGEYAVVGAGSVVLRRVPAHTSVMGVPAKQIFGFSNKERSS